MAVRLPYDMAVERMQKATTTELQAFLAELRGMEDKDGETIVEFSRLTVEREICDRLRHKQTTHPPHTHAEEG